MTAKEAVILFALVLSYANTARAQPPLPGAVSLSPIKDAGEKKDTLSQIRDDLTRYTPHARLIACPDLIDFVEQMPSGHDSSFGGICKVREEGRTKLVMLCDDRMVGRFFRSDRILQGAEQIGLFIQAHCPPGG